MHTLLGQLIAWQVSPRTLQRVSSLLLVQSTTRRRSTVGRHSRAAKRSAIVPVSAGPGHTSRSDRSSLWCVHRRPVPAAERLLGVRFCLPLEGKALRTPTRHDQTETNNADNAPRIQEARYALLLVVLPPPSLLVCSLGSRQGNTSRRHASCIPHGRYPRCRLLVHSPAVHSSTWARVPARLPLARSFDSELSAHPLQSPLRR